MAIGMLCVASGFLLMTAAARLSGDHGRVSPWWLISAYAGIELGELMLSPMGLSLVSKVAPARWRGFLMGGWFAANSVGNYLAGAIGVQWTEWSHARFFLTVAALAAAVSAFLFAIMKPLARALDGA
jgi:POT family proton-dependent oligopeptide transporter